ncbi:hypothetical protein COB55_04025 [Candidatus Wolfebacteria bacterium]|nr:MAG: hypothetical protein COB55_04025 [Candidatus Wolfebacteria bacterium]
MSKLQRYELDEEFNIEEDAEGDFYYRPDVDKLLREILETMHPKMDSLTRGADLIREALGS